MPFLKNRKLVFLLIAIALITITGFKFLSGKVVIGLRHPESAVYYQGYIFVSNIGFSPVSENLDGFITKLDKYGNILEYKFIDHLQAPKGLWVKNNHIYISDLNRVCVANIDTKRMHCIPVKSSRFLNDITLHGNAIYVTDTATNNIYCIKHNKVSIFYHGNGDFSPNGIVFSKRLKAFIVVSFNQPAINIISQKGKLIKSIRIAGYTGFDGVSIYKDKIYISDYRTGRIFAIGFNFRKPVPVKRFDTSVADIGVYDNKLLAPLLEANKLYIGTISQ